MKSNSKIDWGKLFSGYSELLVSGDSIVKLAELAGAPWNDKDANSKLGPNQIALLHRPERQIIVFAGSGGGKSVLGAIFGLAELLKPHRRIALIGDTYTHVSKEFGYLYKGFFNLFPKEAATVAHNSISKHRNDMRLSTAWDSHVETMATRQGEGSVLLGSEYDLVIFCEAAQVPASVYYSMVERALYRRNKVRSNGYRARTGRALFLTTPSGQTGVSYDLYSNALKRAQGDLSSLELRNGANWIDSLYFAEFANIDLNPALDKDAFERYRASLPTHDFATQFLGKAVAKTGRVYKSFDESKHVIDKLPDSLNKFTFGVGIDPGFAAPFGAALVGMSPEGTLHLLNERCIANLNSKEMAEEILAMVSDTLGHLSDDPKELISEWEIDAHCQTHKLDLPEYLGVDISYRKHELLSTLAHLDMCFANNQVFVMDDCDHFKAEARTYRYRSVKGSLKDEPTGPDHVLDAFRYVALVMLENGPNEVTAAPKSFAEILEERRNQQLQVGSPTPTRKPFDSVFGGNW